MYAIIGQLIAKIGISLLTEKVLKEVFAHTFWYFADKSDNKLIESYAKTVGEALNVNLD